MDLHQNTLSKNSRIGIINRGEPALRFIRGVREYNNRHATELTTVAFYVEAEKNSPFVRLSDNAFSLTALYPGKDGAGAIYLDKEQMIRALVTTRCDAVWLGWGFLSEDADFIARLEKKGLLFIGPTSLSMAALGDKIRAKQLAETAGVPVVPWTKEPITDVASAKTEAEKIGYPCMIKAAHAGGGRGIRAVYTADEFEARFASAREETIRVTGGEALYIEKLIEKGRHLEVQVLADTHGNVNTFGVRDCSVQRKNQKIIEETPPENLDEQIIASMEKDASRLITAVGYRSAGTVEFLYDIDNGQYYFMEVNTRLQVEHPITEELFGVDLVEGQLRVAFGKTVRIEKRRRAGSVIEVRLNAEDPDQGFTPSPGTVTVFHQPAGPGIRVDSGIQADTTIPREFDSMVAKIIARGNDRPEAIARLRRAVEEMHISIEGGTTNRSFLLTLLNERRFIEGSVHTRFVEELLAAGGHQAERKHWLPALLAACAAKYMEFFDQELINFKQQLIFNGQPRSIGISKGTQVTLTAQEIPYRIEIKTVDADHFLVESEGSSLVFQFNTQNYRSLLGINGQTYRIQTVDRGGILQCEVNGVPYPIGIESSGEVRAPSPSMVLSIHAQPGDIVEKGDVLLVLEAMKMEMIVSAPECGTVKEIVAKAGEQVVAGQVLVRLEAEKQEDSTDSGTAEKIHFVETSQQPEEVWQTLERSYKAVFLGYDHIPEIPGLIERMKLFCRENPDFEQRYMDTLVTGVFLYADIEVLFSTDSVEAVQPASPETESPIVNRSSRELLSRYVRRETDREKGMPAIFLEKLKRALAWYNAEGGTAIEEQRIAVFRMYTSHNNLELKNILLHHTLFAIEKIRLSGQNRTQFSDALTTIGMLTHRQSPSLADAAFHAKYTLIDKTALRKMKQEKSENIDRMLNLIVKHGEDRGEGSRHMRNIISSGHYVFPKLVEYASKGEGKKRALAWYILTERFLRDRTRIATRFVPEDEWGCIPCGNRNGKPLFSISSSSSSSRGSGEIATLLSVMRIEDVNATIQALREGCTDWLGSLQASMTEIILLFYCEKAEIAVDPLVTTIEEQAPDCTWLSFGLFTGENLIDYRTFSPDVDGRMKEQPYLRTVNPIQRRELRMDSFALFSKEQLYAGDSVFLFACRAIDSPKDERLVAFVDVPSARMEQDEQGHIKRMVALENVFMEAVYAMRAEQAKRTKRLFWNRICIHIPAVLNTNLEQIREYASMIASNVVDLGIEKLTVYSKRPAKDRTSIEEVQIDFENISGTNFTLKSKIPSDEPITPMNRYEAKVVRARQRNTLYPYEIIKMITRSGYQLKEIFPKGEFEEFDIEIDAKKQVQRTISVKGREYGRNGSNVVFGIITNYIASHPQGVRRVIILSDTTTDMGSLSEPECRRIIAAIDLAESEKIPVEWLPVSAGAKIDMHSGTENLDWTARTLKRIVEFTENRGEINIIVAGINVGAQSYWNAESTMLMHTRGILLMTDDAAMLLTGKKALDFSGSVSAEDNVGIGGVKRIMGPNGQAQVAASGLYRVYSLLFTHYSLTYVQPGKRYPERIDSSDPEQRDIGETPYVDTLGQGFTLISDLFSKRLNPERKKPFDMRQLMNSLVDRDAEHLERWAELQGGETAIVWEARIGGYASGVIGIESKVVARLGGVPHDGPEVWSGGTLYPLASKKVARAINAFSGHLPLVILANLSGFDGSPDSLRNLQLEYGAEIGKAVVDFDGPIVFVVTARYHGGAYVVFSKHLNPRLHAVAIEGSYASVIGGAPAAAVVFPGRVKKETFSDRRIVEAQQKMVGEKSVSQKEYDELFYHIYTEKQAAIASQFDSLHTVERAKQVGSIDEIVTPKQLRPYIIRKLQNGTT